MSRFLLAVLFAASLPAAAQPTFVPMDGPVGAGPIGAQPFALATASDGAVWAIDHDRVYRLTGDVWEAQLEVESAGVYALAAGPDGAVWVGSAGAWSGRAGGPWNWHEMRTPAGHVPTVSAVAVSPDGSVFASGFRSHDGGTTWRSVPFFADAYGFRGDGVVYAAVHAGVRRSADGGATWSDASGGFTVSDWRFTDVVGTPHDVFVASNTGIWRLNADGRSWTRVFAAEPGDGYLMDLHAHGEEVWAVSQTRLLHSADGGRTWAGAAPAAALGALRGVTVDGAGRVIVAGPGGFLASTDGGAAFRALNRGLSGLPLSDVLPFEGGYLAGTRDAGVFRFQASGRAWESLSAGLPSPYVLALAQGADGAVYARSSGAFSRLRADGRWARLAVRGADLLDIGHLPDGGLIGVVRDSAGEHHAAVSADGGATWDLRGGLPILGAFFGETFAVTPEGAVYVQSMSGSYTPVLFRSKDGGHSWDELEHPFHDTFETLEVWQADAAGRVYANGLRSDDGGASFTRFAPESASRPRALFSNGPRHVLSTDAGVYFTADDGATWATLDVPAVEAFHTGPDGYLYAVTGDGALLRGASDLAGGLTAADQGAHPAAPTALAVRGVFPNPAAHEAVLRLDVPSDGSVTLVLHDVLGRVVRRQVVDGAAGARSVPLELAGVAPGLYIVRAEAAGAVATARLTVVR